MANENKLQNTSLVSVVYLQCKVLTSMLEVLLGTHSDLITVCTEPVNLILQLAQLIISGVFFPSIVQFACYMWHIIYFTNKILFVSQLVTCLYFFKMQLFLQRILLLRVAPLILIYLN